MCEFFARTKQFLILWLFGVYRPQRIRWWYSFFGIDSLSCRKCVSFLAYLDKKLISLVYLKVDGSGVRPVKLRFVIFGRLTLIGKLWKFFSTNSGYDSDGFVEFFPFKKFGLKITAWRFLHYKSWYPSRGKYFSHVTSLVWCYMGYRYTKPSTLLKSSQS